MKTTLQILALTLGTGLSLAQLPINPDLSGKSSGSPNVTGQPGTNTAPQQNGLGGQPATNTGTAPQQGTSTQGGAAPSSTGATEPTNPQLLGMEIPLMDPANDTVRYNGATFDVGNNALVRARFEKYLQQTPDESAEAQRYRARINAILNLTRESGRSDALVSSATLVKIGRGLYDIAEFPADGGQADALASAIISVLDAQRANVQRDFENEKLDGEIDKLVEDINKRTNRMTDRVGGTSGGGGENGPRRNSGSGPKRDTTLIKYDTKEVTEMAAEQKANDLANTASLAMAKVSYQSAVLNMLMLRRFDHAIIGARIYRHLFVDGDPRLKMNKSSKASKFFSKISGMPPTISTMDSVASTARREIDQNMEAVASLLAQNKLADATQHLILAVAIGEYMQSVTTFPTEHRLRIAQYWSLRKRILTALNARDYGTAEEIAQEMKKQDADFDDSLVMSYCAGKKRESDLHLRNAFKALQAGEEEKFSEEIRQAGIIWPRNPKLDEGADKLTEFDNKDAEKKDFKILFDRQDFRTIYNEQERFEIVAIDPDLKQNYKDALTIVATMDAMLNQLEEVAKQDKKIGPCAAYETLIEKLEEEPRYGKDIEYKDAISRYTNLSHDFVSALNDAKDCESRQELGSALSNYYRALTIFPSSKFAKKGADALKKIIMEADY